MHLMWLGHTSFLIAVHFYITLLQINISTVFVLAPQISSLCYYNTNFTNLTHQEWLWATVEGMKIIMSSLQFSAQLYKTFPELDGLKTETLNLSTC